MDGEAAAEDADRLGTLSAEEASGPHLLTLVYRAGLIFRRAWICLERRLSRSGMSWFEWLRGH